MNKESKFAKAVGQISKIGVIVIPIFTILYFLWFQATSLFIFLKYYKIILYSCDLVL